MEQQYEEAIQYLQKELTHCTNKRVKSLLAYCYYMNQDFQNACLIYEQLTFDFPLDDNYWYQLALSFYKNGDFELALKEAQKIDNQEFQQKVSKLNAYIYYEIEDYQTAKQIIQKSDPNSLEMTNLTAAILLKEKRLQESQKQFQEVRQHQETNAELIYNLALVFYHKKEYDKSMSLIAEIIEKGLDILQEIQSNENNCNYFRNKKLKESALIEAFNLKAAIEYNLKNIQNAQEALRDMPQWKESDLDPITLMNQALMFFDNNPQSGFEKMNFLLKNPPFPPEIFLNLLLMYIKYDHSDLASDELAENSEIVYKYINAQDYAFIEAILQRENSFEESVLRLKELQEKQIQKLRKITKQIRDSQKDKESDNLQEFLKQYDEGLEAYIPVLMALCKLYMNLEDYEETERILIGSQEFCSINDVWKHNLAHVYFVQEKYEEALTYYEQIFQKQIESILDIPAIVLSNLCVCYIMVNQNHKAEKIIKLLEDLNEQCQAKQLERSPDYHLCIINLVIGTLYCVKENDQFGISWIIKSFEPFGKKMCIDTWFYAKRCFLNLLEKICKFQIIIEESQIEEIIQFLQICIENGKQIKCSIDPKWKDDEKNNVSYEARLIQSIFKKIIT